MFPIFMVLAVLLLSFTANEHFHASHQQETLLNYTLAFTILLPGSIIGRVLYDHVVGSSDDYESVMKGSVLVVNTLLSVGIAVIWHRRRSSLQTTEPNTPSDRMR